MVFKLNALNVLADFALKCKKAQQR